MHSVGAGGRGLIDAEFVEYAEYQQRHQPLRRRRHVVERAGAVRERQRIDELRAMGLQIGECERAAGCRKITRHGARQFATIKIVGALACDAPQRCGHAYLLEHAACCRGCAACQKCLGKTRLRRKLDELV